MPSRRQFIDKFWHEDTSLFDLVYSILWVLAIGGAGIYSFRYFSESGVDLLVRIISYVFAIITMLQFWLIYRDLHKIDHSAKLALGSYGPGINKKPERILRCVLIVVILFGAGKIVTVFDPYT